MQTHQDGEHGFFWDRLKERAAQGERDRTAEITMGKPGERALSEWPHGQLQIRQMPEDEQGILRISVGGGIHYAHIDYCVFRGDRTRCAYLLEEAAKALRRGPPKAAPE